ncbi:MAG: HAD-IA family hydrolase [Candidatus Omnitrophica bacterium]|nr:HAD-IA family hydrolase [Candidatus Omnitrophota bacterium]MBU1997449.1 HAD-IA family hydrolase [Candidatus Omnitrophota bacterium]MBU4334485.1 HAD-IA family hydrolase [Candidatus Omnitrophota bacterium]
MKKDVLVFDFDGTIADTFQSILDISNRLSKQFKYKMLKPDEAESLKDKTLKETLDHLRVPILQLPLILLKARNELHKEIASIQPINGLKEILIQLKEFGFEMGIISSNSRKNVRRFLKINNLDLFDFISTSSKLWGKNRCIKKTLKMNSINNQDVVYIGDEIRDIVAAKKAGVRVAAVTWGYNSSKALKEQEPDYVVNNPKELIALFVDSLLPA